MSRKTLVLAAAIWVICAFELVVLAVRAVLGTVGGAPWVGGLLAQPELADRAVPIGLLTVFAWVMLRSLTQAARIAREQTAVEHFEQEPATDLDKLPETLRAGRRARLIHQHAGDSPGILGEMLPAAAALDAVALDNSYGVLKSNVWTLPVLGFIGTAGSMAHAIAGFKDALPKLSAQVGHEQIAVLTDRLGQTVIPGLANAFSVTMLALACSIAAHFWVTAVQAWDQEVLQQLDRASLAKLTELSAHGAYPDRVQPLFDKITALVTMLGGLLGRLDLGSAAQRLEQAAHAHELAAQTLREAVVQMQAVASAPYHVTITREQVQ